MQHLEMVADCRLRQVERIVETPSAAPPHWSTPMSTGRQRLADSERSMINHAASTASIRGFRVGVIVTAGTAILAGLLGVGMRNPRRAVPARECAGEHLLAAPPCDAARRRSCGESAGAGECCLRRQDSPPGLGIVGPGPRVPKSALEGIGPQ